MNISQGKHKILHSQWSYLKCIKESLKQLKATLHLKKRSQYIGGISIFFYVPPVELSSSQSYENIFLSWEDKR